nr:ATP-binding protein [Streptomyces sp. SID3343]
MPALRCVIRAAAEDAQMDVDLLDDVLVVVNELATNGLEHGQEPVTVTVEITAATVVVHVWDAMLAALPALRIAGVHDENGRGLRLVTELSMLSWGRVGQRKYVRAQLPCPRPPRTGALITVDLQPLATPRHRALAW